MVDLHKVICIDLPGNCIGFLHAIYPEHSLKPDHVHKPNHSFLGSASSLGGQLICLTFH